mmetsp:Transcript_18517/g.48375  ORF Transcript_18517/g.48375 Transcript_18517/m.48375 type:complete len:226 (+) Transcript_18517:609-1286(+)
MESPSCKADSSVDLVDRCCVNSSLKRPSAATSHTSRSPFFFPLAVGARPAFAASIKRPMTSKCADSSASPGLASSVLSPRNFSARNSLPQSSAMSHSALAATTRTAAVPWDSSCARRDTWAAFASSCLRTRQYSPRTRTPSTLTASSSAPMPAAARRSTASSSCCMMCAGTAAASHGESGHWRSAKPSVPRALSQRPASALSSRCPTASTACRRTSNTSPTDENT